MESDGINCTIWHTWLDFLKWQHSISCSIIPDVFLAEGTARAHLASGCCWSKRWPWWNSPDSWQIPGGWSSASSSWQLGGRPSRRADSCQGSRWGLRTCLCLRRKRRRLLDHRHEHRRRSLSLAASCLPAHPCEIRAFAAGEDGADRRSRAAPLLRLGLAGHLSAADGGCRSGLSARGHLSVCGRRWGSSAVFQLLNPFFTERQSRWRLVKWAWAHACEQRQFRICSISMWLLHFLISAKSAPFVSSAH